MILPSSKWTNVFKNGPTPASFSIFSFFSITNDTEKLDTSAGFEVGTL